MPIHTAANVAKRLLLSAAQRLGTESPIKDVGDILDESLAVPCDDPSCRSGRLLEPNFSETTPDNLSFLLNAAGPRVTPRDRIESSTQAMHRVVRNNFGPDAQRWLESRTDGLNSHGHLRSAQWGASFGSGFDRNGLTESLVQYEWGPMMMDALPAPLYRLARTALEALPGLRPALSTIRCGRTSGSQQISFENERPLSLSMLQPLMERLGLGARHSSLMSAVAFILGARFVLPPETAMISLRPARTGVELRLDINLDALPDPPAQLMALMRMQMTERPKNLNALDRWMIALTPDGYPGPGTVSVLSAWVRSDHPARLAIFLRPAVFEGAGEMKPETKSAPAGLLSSGEGTGSSSAWAPNAY